MALRYKLLLSCCALTMTAACAYARGFRLEGRIEGLQAGDTLRFERILLPSWKYGPGFDVVVRKPGAFRHRGKSEHDQYYLMTYRPKAGRAAAGDRGGKPVIVRPGDRIGMTGSTDAIYYCRLGGGIYDEPMLSSRWRSMIRSAGSGGVIWKMHGKRRSGTIRQPAGNGAENSTDFTTAIPA